MIAYCNGSTLAHMQCKLFRSKWLAYWGDYHHSQWFSSQRAVNVAFCAYAMGGVGILLWTIHVEQINLDVVRVAFGGWSFSRCVALAPAHPNQFRRHSAHD